MTLLNSIVDVPDEAFREGSELREHAVDGTPGDEFQNNKQIPIRLRGAQISYREYKTES
jgi:hypothetical protein